MVRRTGLRQHYPGHCRTAALPPDAFYAAIADLSGRFRARSTPALWRRWLADNKASYWAGMWEAAHRSRSIPANFDVFLNIRPHLGLGPSTLSCAELAAGLDVPEPERHAPEVRAVLDAASLLITLDDDMYFYPREHWRAERHGQRMADDPSPIPILTRERNLSMDEAVSQLAEIHDQVMVQALRLADRVNTRRFSADTCALVRIALGAVRSTLNWALHTGRYTNPAGDELNVIRLNWAGVTDEPPTSLKALRYPAIAWWWEL